MEYLILGVVCDISIYPWRIQPSSCQKARYSPKEIFSLIHEKLPTASCMGILTFDPCLHHSDFSLSYSSYIVCTSTIPYSSSTYAKILMHTQPPDPEVQNQILAIFRNNEKEYLELSKKGAALMDVQKEMPKFPERQSSHTKAEDTEADTAEQSAPLRTQQQASNALAVTDQPSANGTPPVSHLGLVKVPSTPTRPSPDVLGDLLGPLAIEGPQPAATQPVHNLGSGVTLLQMQRMRQHLHC
ncbi:hypothetical protein HAX54_027264 [Datura stramonium]|uniref:Uncharacterized protein n=1 Tax=Datura stramonium TaxID=4076 RepID=A0ABS8V217_DATST|nr:hypothetical protein [Datura stramonium]